MGGITVTLSHIGMKWLFYLQNNLLLRCNSKLLYLNSVKKYYIQESSVDLWIILLYLQIILDLKQKK
jgi:hypothetical protein